MTENKINMICARAADEPGKKCAPKKKTKKCSKNLFLC